MTISPWWAEKGGRVQKGFSEDFLKSVWLARWTREKVSVGNNDIKEWPAQPVLRIAGGSCGWRARWGHGT